MEGYVEQLNIIFSRSLVEASGHILKLNSNRMKVYIGVFCVVSMLQYLVWLNCCPAECGVSSIVCTLRGATKQ